jgi:hypothetical protein
MVYWANGTPQDKDTADRMLMVMDDSSWTEHTTADWIRQSAYKLHSEQLGVDVMRLDFLPETPTRFCHTCKAELPGNLLHGHPDGILQDMLDVDIHYEHKGLSHFSFERYWNKSFPIDYITQCVLYNYGLRKTLLPDLKDSLLLIKNKNTSAFIDYLIHYDMEKDSAHVKEICHSNGEKKVGNPYLLTIENIVQGVRDKFFQVHQHTLDGTLPDRPFALGTAFPCSYCLWENTCFDGYGAEFQEMRTDGVFPEELADKARYYKELGAEETDIKEKRDGIKEEIKAEMRVANARKGMAGEYELDLRLLHKNAYAVEASEYEVLYVKNKNAPKKGGRGKK